MICHGSTIRTVQELEHSLIALPQECDVTMVSRRFLTHLKMHLEHALAYVPLEPVVCSVLISNITGDVALALDMLHTIQ